MKEPIFKCKKNSLLELEKDFIDLKDIELKDREIKIKREIEELFFKSIIVSMIWIGLKKKKEMKKIRPNKNTWYDWLINYITEPIRESVGGFKDKIVSLFNRNTPKQTVNRRRKKLSKPKKLNKPKMQNIKKSFISEENKEKIKDRIFGDIWTLFETEEEKGERKELEKKKHNERSIKDRLIRDIRTLFEYKKEDYYQPERVNNF